METELRICKRCGQERKIYAKEMCKSCYNYTVSNKDKQKIYFNFWKEKNPDYWINYYIDNKDDYVYRNWKVKEKKVRLTNEDNNFGISMLQGK